MHTRAREFNFVRRDGQVPASFRRSSLSTCRVSSTQPLSPPPVPWSSRCRPNIASQRALDCRCRPWRTNCSSCRRATSSPSSTTPSSKRAVPRDLSRTRRTRPITFTWCSAWWPRARVSRWFPHQRARSSTTSHLPRPASGARESGHGIGVATRRQVAGCSRSHRDRTSSPDASA